MAETEPTSAALLTSIKPPGKMTNDELIQFVRSRAYTSSPLYAEDFSRFRKSELYDQSDQWLQRARGTSDATYPSQWRRLQESPWDPNAVPLPVLNEGVLLRENESARLGRPEYKPKVKPSGSNPGITEKDGAKGAERAVQSRLKEMWSDEEDKLYLHMPLYGGAWLKSYWDQTWMETVRVPAPSLCCPRHPNSGVPPEQQGPPPLAGAGIAGAIGTGGVGLGPTGIPSPAPPGESQLPPPGIGSSLVPPAPTAPGLPTEMPVPGMPMPGMGMPALPGMPAPPAPPPIECSYCRTKERPGQPPHPDGGMCPQCPDSPPLVPYQPTLDEARDPNLDLGIEVPKGDWYLTVPYPYQIFPQDSGIGTDPTDIPEWLEMYTRPLSWAEERWPDKVRDVMTGNLRVHPQNPGSLMIANPTLGSPDILQFAQYTGAYRSHVVVYEYHRKPWLEWDDDRKVHLKNKGRSVIAVVGAGGEGVVCLDDVLLLESLNKPGTFVPRAKLQYIVWEKRDGGRRSTVGQSLWDRIFDAQDGLNERISQARAVNQRGAMPWVMQRRGINMETRAADAAVPFRRVLVDLDPQDRQLPLQTILNETINPGVYEEIQYYSNFMGKHVVEVEKGQVPPGVAAATAIAYLKTESGEKRRPRILRIRRSITRAWEHGLQLMSARYIEDRPYSYEDDEDNEERSAFINGDVIAKANPKVDIYPTPDYDITDARRESIRDQVQLGILNPQQTPQLSRKISAAMDESLDFFLDDDLQEQQAQREWKSFKESGRVPVLDPSLDDHLTHYQEHGRSCFSEWFRDKEDEANWDGALSVLNSDWDAGLQLISQIALGVIPMPGMVPGQPPPPKPSIDKLIMKQWVLKLQAAQFQASPVLVQVIIPWRAHMEAHKLSVEIKQMREQMKSAPAVPAPGTGSAPTSQVEMQAGEGPPPAPM